MNTNPIAAPSSGLDLGDIYYVLFRHKWKILLCSLAGILSAAAIYRSESPPFQSEAKLLVRYIVSQDKPSALAGNAQATRISPDDRGASIMNTEVEILTSLDLAESVAKAISPALRMGFIAAPHAVAANLAHAVERDRLHASWPVQASMQWLLASGELQRHLRRVRRHHAGQRDHLVQALKQHCPAVRFRGQEGGLHMVLTMGEPTSDKQLARQLRSLGITLQTIREFGGDSDEVLLGYGHMHVQEIEHAVGLLAKALSPLKGRKRSVGR